MSERTRCRTEFPRLVLHVRHDLPSRTERRNLRIVPTWPVCANHSDQLQLFGILFCMNFFSLKFCNARAQTFSGWARIESTVYNPTFSYLSEYMGLRVWKSGSWI